MSSVNLLEAALDDLDNTDVQRRAKAYAELARALDGEEGASLDIIKKECVKRIGDSQTAARGLSALTVIIQLQPQSAIKLFQDDSLANEIEAQVKDSTDNKLQLAFAGFCNTSASIATLRPVLVRFEAQKWCQTVSTTAAEVEIRTLCIVALVKLLFKEEKAQEDMQRYAEQLLETFLATQSATENTIRQTALEGLAILSLLKTVRQILCGDSKFLATLCKSSPAEQQKSPLASQADFSTANLLFNLTRYKPVLSEEERASEKLAKMAIAKENGDSQKSNGEISWEDDAAINARNAGLVGHDVCSLLSALSTSPSAHVRSTAGNIFCNLTQQQSVRGKLLQGGAAKALLRICSNGSTAKDADLLPACQAFSRLLVTTNPLLIFGPTPTAPLLLEAVAICAAPLIHEQSTYLQQFESLLALTNIASVSEAARTKTIQLSGVMAKVESLMIDVREGSNAQVMCRRAATQLITNIVLCEAAFVHFAGDSSGITEKATCLTSPPQTSKTRLHILLAMCDVEDNQTRMAAGGALATMTASPTVCAFILSPDLDSRGLSIFGRMLADDEEVSSRSLACLANILERMELYDQRQRHLLRDSDIKKALERLANSNTENSQAARGMALELAKLN